MKLEQQNNENEKPRTNPYTGLLVMMLVVMLLNVLVFPKLTQKQIINTDYGTFIGMVEEGKVKKVNIEDNRIYFSALDSSNSETTYQTGAINDAELVGRLLNAKSPNETGRIIFTKTIPHQNSPILNFLLMWVIPGLIFYLIWRQMSRMVQGHLGSGDSGNVMSFGKSGAKIYAESEIKTTFADVAGQEEAKDALSEIVDFLHNPDKYTGIGASLPKGALLVGPPGTGKTLIARAVAGEAKVPFFSISGSEFVQMFVGMGAAKVRDLFKQASQKAPCIIFIDEIDTIGKKRDNSLGGNDEREQTLNQLLTEMDGFDGQKGVVILAATNRPESLDKALLRPGRFDRRIQMELPDLQGRKDIFEVHLKKVKHENIDLNLVARATAGSSGAEIANIVNEAALRAVRMKRNSVTTTDLEESVEVVIAGMQKKGKVISDNEKKIIAYHEIGHAIVAAKQTNSAPVHKITIIPRTSGALGYTMQIDSGEQNLMSREDMLNRITTLTGGRAAEEIICGTVTTGASNDIEQATKLARAMITRYGMSEKYDMMALETVNNPYLSGDSSLTCSNSTASEVDQEVLQIIRSAHQKARQIISENINEVHATTTYLLEKETITGDEFMEILSHDNNMKK
jgi:cell division protease FtsH